MYHNTLEQGYELANAYDTCKKTSPYMLSHGGGGSKFHQGDGKK